MSNDLSLYEQIVDGWERTETENSTPYYINHKTERTSWDHPYWLKIVEGLKENDSVKYSAYRTSLKIRQLQKQLKLNHVEICTIRNEFEEAGYTEGSWGEIQCDVLLTVLVNMFRNSPDSYSVQEEPDMLADITLNLLLNLFDKDKTGFVRVMSVKCMLVTLCHAKLTDKYRYFYQELHDPSTFINSHTLMGFLEALLKVLLGNSVEPIIFRKPAGRLSHIKNPTEAFQLACGRLVVVLNSNDCIIPWELPEFLHESAAFGRNCEPAVASCCQMGQESGGITEDVFYRWLHKEPQTIVWLPTFHRIVSTENLKHDAKCNVCKACPMIGFRYKCLKCFNFDLCQTCFFTGKTKKKHKPNHPIQEYCLNSTAKDDTSAFVKTIKNNLSRKQRRKARLKYLPIEADSQYTNPAWSPGYDLPEPDVHSEILETAKKLADVEDSQTQTEDTTRLTVKISPDNTRLFPPPKHLIFEAEQEFFYAAKNKAQLEHPNLSPKDDGLQHEREELNAYIKQLEEENRALYAQMSSLRENSDTESYVSDDRFSPDHYSRVSPNPHRLPETLREVDEMPMREPHPCETTPIFLSVPIIHVNGHPFRSLTSSPKTSFDSPGLHSAFHQPYFHSPVSYLPPPTYGSPPRDRTLGDSLDNLEASPSKFSLPSPSKSMDEFHVEEAELQAIVNKVGSAFPTDLSMKGPHPSRFSTGEDEMLQAANSIGVAMSDFVNRAVCIRLPQ